MKTSIWTVSIALCLAPAGAAQLSEGDIAPSIEISTPLKTGIKKFKDLKGKVLLLDFFTTT